MIDGVEGSHSRETDGKHGEVSLQSWVDGEATSGRVHASNVLNIVDFLEYHLLPIIPMFVVQMLSYQCMWLNSTIQINLLVIYTQ